MILLRYLSSCKVVHLSLPPFIAILVPRFFIVSCGRLLRLLQKTGINNDYATYSYFNGYLTALDQRTAGRSMAAEGRMADRKQEEEERK